jgi:hypothetical protein
MGENCLLPSPDDYAPPDKDEAAKCGGLAGSRIGWVAFGALSALRSARACGSWRTSGASWPSWTCCADRASLAHRTRVAFFTLGSGRAWRSRWPLEAAAKG